MRNKRINELIINYLRRGNFTTSLWGKFSTVLIKIFGPKLAAYICYANINWQEKESNTHIVCLSRESFIKDIAELRSRGDCAYHLVTGFTRFQSAWLPPEMQIQTFYQSYNGDDKERGCKKSEIYAKELIKLINKKHKVAAVLSANFDYWQDIGFKFICKDSNIPFLVLSREHPIIPKVCDEVSNWYSESKYSFNGTAIAVAGKSTKDVLEKSKNICSSEKIIITGLPRYDAWIDINVEIPISERPYITLLTFSQGYYADRTFLEVLTIFCNAAKYLSSEKVEFLIKTKDLSDTIYVKNALRNINSKNIKISHEIGLFEILPLSRLVVGYNSLSLIEAIMAKSLIALPAWGECKDNGDDVMYTTSNPNTKHVAKFVYSSDELMLLIKESMYEDNPISLDKETKIFIQQYIHLPEKGSISYHFEEFVTKQIKDTSIAN